MTMPISRRPLGNSDTFLSAIGLGCWQFSLGKGLVGKFWDVLDKERIQEIVDESLQNGINWFDTAEIYGRGESERALSQALLANGCQPGEVFIASKWWPIGRRASHILSSIQERQECLAPYPIDLYQIHQPYAFSSIRSQMDAMAKLVEKGAIRYVGVSNFNAKQMRIAHQILSKYGIKLVSNQVKYSLLDRRIERNGIIDVAKELKISIIAYSPLEQGLLTGRFHENPSASTTLSGPRKFQGKFKRQNLLTTKPLIDVLRSLTEKYQATVSQLALNWLITAHGETVLAIPGASKVKQARDNAGSLQFQLEPEDIEKIDKISKSTQNR
ncbi:aldo/keto reductase [Alicyclobacillus tolerans]|uniref:aldo/keto reductase n=1 Tax=Alicyclobacillus tolerans TaxID=90970 RepID=UPI003B769F3F